MWDRAPAAAYSSKEQRRLVNAHHSVMAGRVWKTRNKIAFQQFSGNAARLRYQRRMRRQVVLKTVSSGRKVVDEHFEIHELCLKPRIIESRSISMSIGQKRGDEGIVFEFARIYGHRSLCDRDNDQTFRKQKTFVLVREFEIHVGKFQYPVSPSRHAYGHAMHTYVCTPGPDRDPGDIRSRVVFSLFQAAEDAKDSAARVVTLCRGIFWRIWE
ncbi:hypothetical protein R3P38DRAFT_2799263 [Favolaschia claudopus]|uniref:Uncharacterized protein n=1 Tax=Favolaschia claudopus TaxID=2862362 RepID=A0AAW0A0G6_9AGAR